MERAIQAIRRIVEAPVYSHTSMESAYVGMWATCFWGVFHAWVLMVHWSPMFRSTRFLILFLAFNER